MARAFRRGGKTKGRVTEDMGWLDDGNAVALPNYGIAEQVASARKRKRMARTVKVAALSGIGAIALSFLSLGVAVRAGDGTQEEDGPPALTVETITSPGRYVATSSLSSWLATVPSPLPGGSIVSWDGATDMGLVPAGTSGADRDLLTTLESFTVIDGTGQAYTAEYLVGTDTAGGSVVISGPSLIPQVNPPSGVQIDVGWPGVREVDAPAAVDTAVQSWANAYTSGNPDQLRLTVGDSDEENQYQPISGVAEVTTTIVAAGTTETAAIDEDGEQIPEAEALLVRVTLALDWEGRSSGPSASEATMDLLVLRADTGAPAVVAWGSPGTGPRLTEYGNALPALARSEPEVPPTELPTDDSGIAPTEAPTEAPTGSPDDAEQSTDQPTTTP